MRPTGTAEELERRRRRAVALLDQGHGVSFLQDTLQVGYAADDADTFDVPGWRAGS